MGSSVVSVGAASEDEDEEDEDDEEGARIGRNAAGKVRYN
jgi:hypothetical protein